MTIKRKYEANISSKDLDFSRENTSNELGKIPAHLMKKIGYGSLLIPQNPSGKFETVDRTKHPGAIRVVSI